MVNKGRKGIIVAGIIIIAVTGVLSIWKIYAEKSKSENVYKMALNSGYSGDIQDWAKDILGKSAMNNNGKWWINGYDTGVKADDSSIGQKNITVTKCYSKKDGHLYIRFSNGQQIDGGKADKKIESCVAQYSVSFLDYDGRVLKKELVKRGEAAQAPEKPKRKGYKFEKWDKSYQNVIQNLEVTACYIKNNSPVLFLESIKVKPGDREIKVPIKIKNNPGILGMEISVLYDEKEMKLTGASNGYAFKGVLNFTKGNLLRSGCQFIWDGQEVRKEEIRDGEILVLKFDILDTAKKGEYLINISYKEEDIVDNELSLVSMYVKGGKMIIQ